MMLKELMNEMESCTSIDLVIGSRDAVISGEAQVLCDYICEDVLDSTVDELSMRDGKLNVRVTL